MHGCRNVFLIVDERVGEAVVDRGERALRLCAGDPPFADGILYVQSTPDADARMVLYNRDGSRGAMCGNGIRCVGKYVREQNPSLGTKLAEAPSLERLREFLHASPLAGDAELTATVLAGSAGVTASGKASVERVRIASDAGLRTLYTLTVGDRVESITVDLGPPTLSRAKINSTLPGGEIVDREVSVAGRPFRITCVYTGNLHAVIFVPDVERVELDVYGPALERAPFFSGPGQHPLRPGA